MNIWSKNLGLKKVKNLILANKWNIERSLFILLLFLFQSCTFYPRYKRPCMEMPESWRFVSDKTETVANVRWWEQFQDPVLNELIQEALENNNDLKAATARIAQFQAQLGIVSSQLYPQIYAQGTFSRQRISQTLSDPQIFPNENQVNGTAGVLQDQDLNTSSIVYSNDYLAMLTASYEIDLWGKIRSATAASRAELLGQVDARRTVILTLVSSVAISYILLRKYDIQFHVTWQTIKSREESYRLAKLRFEEGLTSELEVVQAAAELDEANRKITYFQTLIPQQENLLSVLIGHPPNAIKRGKSIVNWQLPPQVPAGLPADLLEQRPDILQAEAQLIAANYRIGEARALYFPDITLTGYYGYESAQLHELFTNPSKTWQWMVNLLQPVFNGGRIINTVNLAQEKKREAHYNYIQAIFKALQEVNDALIAHKNAKRLVIVEFALIRNLEEYLRLANLQYENGLVDYLNVLDAARQLFDAQLQLAQSQAEVFITLINIYKALGGGWIMDAENIMKEEWLLTEPQ